MQSMEELTAQLDNALLGPPAGGPHARAVADDADEEIDLGDLGDIMPELNPNSLVAVSPHGGHPAAAAIGHDDDDDDPLQRQAPATSRPAGPSSGDGGGGPLGGSIGGSGSSSSLRMMEDGDAGGHHPFTYGQLMPPPAAPAPEPLRTPPADLTAHSAQPRADDPLSDPLCGDRGGPSGSSGGGGGGGDEAGPSRPPWHGSGGGGSSSDEAGPSRPPWHGNGGGTSSSEIHEASEEPPLLSPGSRVRLQYTLPPGMQFEAAAAGPSSASSAAPLQPLPRMSQRDVPLVVTVSDPVKKELPGIMFGIMGGYVAYLITSKAPPPSPRRSQASQPPPQQQPSLLSKPVATVRRRFRDFVALSDVLKIRSASASRCREISPDSGV